MENLLANFDINDVVDLTSWSAAIKGQDTTTTTDPTAAILEILFNNIGTMIGTWWAYVFTIPWVWRTWF